jgi:hypothetical protein
MTLSSNTNKTNLVCTVCRQHRAHLRTRKSKLNPGLPLLLCNDCFENKREPRYLVILTYRDKTKDAAGIDGPTRARPYIRAKRYYGDKILAEELM